MIIGVDPGLQGGVAVLYDERDNLVLDPNGTLETFAMPTDDTGVDAKTLLSILHPYRAAEAAYLEKAQAMPGQGVVSMFNYGKSFGIILGVLACIGIPVILVRPQEWQKTMYKNCPDKFEGKDRSVWAFEKRFPHAVNVKGPRGGLRLGRVEAALIAVYARRTL